MGDFLFLLSFDVLSLGGGMTVYCWFTGLRRNPLTAIKDQLETILHKRLVQAFVC